MHVQTTTTEVKNICAVDCSLSLFIPLFTGRIFACVYLKKSPLRRPGAYVGKIHEKKKKRREAGRLSKRDARREEEDGRRREGKVKMTMVPSTVVRDP